MKRRGITLLELLVAAVMTALVTFGAAAAYSTAVRFQLQTIPSREVRQQEIAFEKRIARRIELAYLDTRNDTYLVIGAPEATGNFEPGSNESLTWTSRGVPIIGAAMSSSDDFETQHEAFGPQGGSIELRLSTTPYSNELEQQGLFVREQVPADGDPTQGGYESVFDADITYIAFEAWDGLQWVTEWDSTTMDAPRLPAAIRVTYRRASDDEEDNRTFVVRLPLSDVTSTNPLQTGARP